MSALRRSIAYPSPEMGSASGNRERRFAEFFDSVERGKNLQKEGQKMTKCKHAFLIDTLADLTKIEKNAYLK